MSVINNSLLLGADAAESGYQISRSLRFNEADGAYLSRTPASASNRKTFTWAGWVKKSDGSGYLLTTSNTEINEAGYLYFTGNNELGYWDFRQGGNGNVLETSSLFRDPSAWYHIVFRVDYAAATASDRAKIYVNGVEQPYKATNYPSTTESSYFNAAVTHYVAGGNTYLNAYLADVHFIDGQALDPTSFGEFDIDGIWQPKAFSGSYGTNGFRLDFADNSAATAAALGKDTSGNGNNWTPTNLSVTAGAGNDSLVDSPTSYGTNTGVGGEVRGNYCTLNPLTNPSGDTFSDGNLKVTTSVVGYGSHISTIATPLSGKWYAEIMIGTNDGLYTVVGLVSTASNFTDTSIPADLKGVSYYSHDGQSFIDSVSSSYGTAVALAANDVLGIAYDADNGTATFYRNGTSQGQITGVPVREYFFAASDYWLSASTFYVWNFGQRPFAYTAPSGFKALNTANLPAPVVTKPNAVMDVALYTGNNTARSITGLGFSPDFVWIKRRDVADDHYLFDSVRTATKYLYSNSTAAEVTSAASLTSFDSAGFSLGTSSTVNSNANSFVAWTWDAGSSTVTNTAGSISSQVRANASAGFSIVSYTGDQGSTFTVAHGLNVQPAFVITKARNASDSWGVYYTNNGVNTNWIVLNSTAAQGANDGPLAGGAYMVVNSSTLQIASTAFANGGSSMIAYCFAPVAGYSSFGSYTGNGSADGPFVYTGFRPRYVLVKGSSVTSDWWINDSARSTYNQTANNLVPNASSAEYTGNDFNSIDILSNGFKMRNTNTSSNSNSATYIYAAFAEHPFSLARAR
jgi:hypothetical protein